MGPWTDYFPTSGGVGQADFQFGWGIGTIISGGLTGARIRAITIDPPFNIIGNNAGQNWKVVVLRGKLPDDGKGGYTLPIELQQATQGWPRIGDSSQNFQIAWSKIINNDQTPNSLNNTKEVHFPFPDDCDSMACEAGEYLTVILFPMFNETGVPGYGANNKTYMSVNVHGTYAAKAGPKPLDSTARSIERGVLGT